MDCELGGDCASGWVVTQEGGNVLPKAVFGRSVEATVEAPKRLSPCMEGRDETESMRERGEEKSSVVMVGGVPSPDAWNDDPVPPVEGGDEMGGEEEGRGSSTGPGDL